MGAYRSRKGANVLTNASQIKRSAAPENRVDKEKNSARRRSVGRARLCRRALVGGGGVGGGVPESFGCELVEAIAVREGEGSRGVDGISGVDGDGGSMASGAWGEG